MPTYASTIPEEAEKFALRLLKAVWATEMIDPFDQLKQFIYVFPDALTGNSVWLEC